MPVLPAIDKTVKIPKAVLAAAAAANAAHGQIYNPEQPPQEGQEPPVTHEGNEAPPQAAEPAQPPQEAPAAPEGNKPVDWERRYNAMKGRYETETKRLNDRINQLVDELRAMRTAPPPVSAPPSELSAERLIKPEEEQDYGTEFLDVVGRKAKEEIAPELQYVKAQLQRVEQQVAMSAQERLLNDLAAAVPNWQAVNTNPKFLDWLKLPDPYSGGIRQDMLNAAFGAHHAPRVIAFFKGFLAEEAATDPASGGQTAPRAPAPGAKVDLAEFAAPGRAKSAAAPAPAEKPSFTRAQIAAFYADKAAGRFRGREADADLIERQIFDAQANGRIR